MNVFYVLNGKKLKHYFIMLLAAVFTVGVVYAERGNITVFQQEESPAAIYNVDTDRKVLALTFDISWGDTRAEPIIETLQQKGVKKATFFLSAPWSEAHPEIVKKIQDAGYEIGSHGHKHDNYSQMSDEEIRKQLRTAHQILTKVTGQPPKLLRLPNGDFDKRVLRIADEMGYKTIQWDTDSKDWTNPGVERIISTVVSRAHPGDIVLLHASDSAKQTGEALPAIIDELRAKGYSFASVTELISGTDVKGNKAQEQQPAPKTTAPAPSNT
ncbi:polysaccharide deacetylase family sporulation protein PdaB [Paenibacillus sp.]|uniref:polysaccharide deacetylase family sporulation protein PdaB n=1 Tax=Paenibacillus sp. TaxID=58172 RepID=UPI002D671B2E|nr:polysaccharide deacetylase family sporulation protein PdaB [Paenibacillus sp.]HZG86960.1 polysaccharide deacetylase family sporulation protein PdaB [Paenibacillus sp.]